MGRTQRGHSLLFRQLWWSLAQWKSLALRQPPKAMLLPAALLMIVTTNRRMITLSLTFAVATIA